jgi:hypothetical protein
MSSIEITLKLLEQDFPMLAKLKKKDMNKFIYRLIKTGYDIYFPSNDKVEKEIEHQEILEKINQLKDEMKEELANSDLETKINSLEFSLNKLIGISSNSQKKGNFGENVLEDIVPKRYGDIKFERKSDVAHSGDAWLYLPDYNGKTPIIMLESKNYTNTVGKEEIIKMQNDMITHNILWGIFVSFNSSIQGMREMDFHTFTHMNNTYYVVMVSNLSSDIHKLDLAMQIIRKLIVCIDNPTTFPWVVTDINNSMHNLEMIVQKNYILRDSFYSMEGEIQKQLSLYHNKLRDYQYEIEQKILEITNKIKSTMETTVNMLEESTNSYQIILETYKDKKILPLVVRTIDMIQSKEWYVKKEENENEWSIMSISSKTTEIGKLKIQQKKVEITIISNDIKVVLNLGKEKEIKMNLELIKSLEK